LATSNPTTTETAVATTEIVTPKEGLNRAALWIVFAAAIFPTHVWALIDFFREYTVWIKRMNTSELLGAFSYLMGVFTLPDAIFLFLGVLLLALILPYRLFRQKFATLGSALALITAVWFMIFHLFPKWLEQRNLIALGLWAVSYAVVVGAAYVYIRRSPKVAAFVDNFMQRAVGLAGLYLFIDLLCIINVVFRAF
jgi:hypothetical protein